MSGYKTMILGGAMTLLGGYQGCSNFNKYIESDKKITTEITMAGATTTLNKEQGSISMESCLENAEKGSELFKNKNLAIFWNDLDFYEGNNLTKLISVAKQQAREIGMLDQAYKTKIIPENAPNWVRQTYQNNVPSDLIASSTIIKRLSDNEFLSAIRDAYEGLNDAVSGGVVVSGEGTNSNNMSLLDILDEAKNNAWLPWTDIKYKDMQNVHAHTYFALIYANMAKLDEAVNELTTAKKILDNYPDDALMSMAMEYNYLKVGYMKNSIESNAKELNDLNKLDISQKYTSGWFGQIQKKSESLGAEEIFIGDVASKLSGKQGEKSTYYWILGVLGACVFGVGLYNKLDYY
jgi:hypothetical protein